jgi:hypothetical protein
MIQQTFQGYYTLTEELCIARFFTTLAQCYSFTQESFPCQLVVSPHVSMMRTSLFALSRFLI